MEKTKRFNVIDFVIVFALFMIMIISFVRSGDADYQLIHEIYYYVGASALMLVILWQRKAKIFNIVTLVFLLCLGLGLLYYMWNNRRNWGFEYDLFLSTKGMMYGLFVIFLIDVIKKREESLKHLFNNRLFAIVTVITLIGMSTINIQGIFSVICPFIMLYLTYIEKDRLRVLFLYLSFAIYSVFFMYFIYSLLFCRAETINGRYSGCFRYLMNAAMLSSGALLAVIYSFDYFYAIAKKKAGLVIVSLAAVALPTAAELLLADKIVLIGLLAVAFILLTFYSPSGIGWKKKRSIIVISLTVSAGLLFVISLAILIRTGLMKNILNGEYNDNIFIIIFKYIFIKLIIPLSKVDSLRDISVLETIDSFSGGRLTILKNGLKMVTFMGGSKLAIEVSDKVMAPHNTYLTWLLLYGWIAGGSIVVWYLSYFVSAIKGFFSNKKYLLFTALWAVLCGIAFLAEGEYHYNLSIFLILVFQYPLLAYNSREDIKNS